MDSAEEYKRLMKERDTSYKAMTLPEILDLYSKFHYVQFRSASDWCCTCVHNLRDCICAHSTLMAMVFDASIEVPDSGEESFPTVRKIAVLIALKHCTAGTKLKKHLAAKPEGT